MKHIELTKDFLGYKENNLFVYNGKWDCYEPVIKNNHAEYLSIPSQIFNEAPHLIREVDPKFNERFLEITGITTDVFKKSIDIFIKGSGSEYRDLSSLIDRIIQNTQNNNE